MDTLRIDAGQIRLTINDDPARVISFNPTDVGWVERFYQLSSEFDAKQTAYERRAKQIEAGEATQAEGLAFVREVCEWMCDRIDFVFGAGTSQAAFDGQLSFDLIEQFFMGITPVVERARGDRIAKYINTKQAGRVMK